MQKGLNFAFFGTPDVASETLEILKSAGYLPSLIVTSPDAKSGRGMALTPPPTKVWAENNNIPYIQPEKLTDLAAKPPSGDLFIIVAYGKIMPEALLNLPKFGSINIHYSLLPKYRGASPVESAILNGEAETGVTIQQMAYELDAGDIIDQEKTPIGPDETAPELRERLIKLGGELLVKTLPKIISGNIQKTKQKESKATFSKKIKKEDGLLTLEDLAAKPPSELYNRFRAYAAWPRIYFFSAKGGSASGGKDAKRYIITDAALENGKFVIKKVIPEGGKEIDWKY